ncbi:DNA (cytosine-5-)-methyltransferase [Metamycoplasma hominis]|uniref:DNA (cytosine-5-)-methyltransferase n=1 Tax=Metamycoplasma hominis TaxID=2098 RepID=UPI00037058CC|nr:DNA (cytosine-5-)-methyltransferase [Metamycoplasma hominis]AIU34083.1 DNA modification methylase [Metamycoplasma hominis ATCC 27545]
MKKKCKVIELFAGVGGFRVGLNNIKEIDANGHAIENKKFDFVWANQWEPSTKTQHAFDCYNLRFPEEFNSNEDISTVNKKNIPDHDLLCGGFPCQDYSVAHSLSKEKGIEGKKGVLWWQIREILAIKKSPFVFLENVDRLIKSPAKQRGRDFGIMLKCFDELGYSVEWRTINAADYGFPQRRRRIYIFAYRKNTNFYKKIINLNEVNILTKEGIFAGSFPIKNDEYKITKSNLREINDLADFSDKYKFKFENSGIMMNGIAYTTKTYPIYVEPITLGKIVEQNVDRHYYLNENEKAKFEYLRGGKKIPRIDANGFEYIYSEGSMSPFDDLNLPGRTMLTSEGSINRSTHIIKDFFTKKLRILTPIECERLNQFPDNWTNSGMPEKRRYFMMGNALVCGVINKIGKSIEKIIDEE